MSRQGKVKKRVLLPDPVYNSILVTRIINKILIKGKKTLAQKIFYQAMRRVTSITKKEPMDVLKKAVRNVTPKIGLRSKRVRGTVYKVPIKVSPRTGNSMALRFIIEGARNRGGRTMIIRLSNEIVDAFHNLGNAARKKEEIQKKAQSNKAFSKISF